MAMLWKILEIFILFSQVNSNYSYNQTPNTNEDFESIIYNLTVTSNLKNSIFDGLLLLKVSPKTNISEIVLSKENYAVDLKVSGVDSEDLIVDQENEILRLKLNKPLTKGKKYVMTMNFKNKAATQPVSKPQLNPNNEKFTIRPTATTSNPYGSLQSMALRVIFMESQSLEGSF